MQRYKTFSTPKEVLEWTKLHYTKTELEQLTVKNNLNTPLADYKGNAYRWMNDYVRLHLEDKQSDYDIKGLQNLLLSKTICESITVSRFVSVKEFCVLWWNTRVGKIYEYPAFLSTTLLKDHYQMDDIKRGRIPITINVPKNTRGTYIPEVNHNMPEFEILLPYRLKIKRLSWMVYEIVDDR